MTRDAKQQALNDLITVRDWLRWAASRFNAAGLAYGHGTTNAVDEAAFLILKTLHLPIDQLEPWLAARLTIEERVRLFDIIDARITTRKPAAYLVNEAWIGLHSFYVDERVIVPRSLIGELLRERLPAVLNFDADQGAMLDLCTGSGSLAILAALAFPSAFVDATDISNDALAVAAQNVSAYKLESRITLHAGDLFAPIPQRMFDLILCNPPYVGDAAMTKFPVEHRAEPAIAHSGGRDGLDIVRRILRDAGAHLNAGGNLIMEVGGAKSALEAEYPDLPFVWLDTEETEGEVFWLKAEDLLPRASCS
jgi:ribosomal protein L3 glutamine methyltransferase